MDKDFCRLFFVDHVRHAFGIMKKSKHEEAKKAVLEIEQRLKKVLEKLKGEMAILSQEKKEFELGRAEISVSHIENLLKDVEGEVTLAFKQQYSFDHWGYFNKKCYLNNYFFLFFIILFIVSIIFLL